MSNDVTSLHELAANKLNAARKRAAVFIDDANRAVTDMIATGGQSALRLKEWDLTPLRPSESEIAHEKLAEAQTLFSRATFPDYLIAATAAQAACTAAGTAKRAYQADSEDRPALKKHTLESEISILMARAASLSKSVEASAREHAPKMLADAQTALRQARAVDAEKRSGYQDLQERLALWRTAVSALEDTAATARSRQVAYGSAVSHNEALKRAAVKKGWIAAAIAAAICFWGGLILNTKNPAGCACCVSLLAVPLITFVAVAVTRYAAGKQDVPGKL